MEETNLSLAAEIKLYYDLYIPDGLAAPAPLLIAVHGYGAHKRYMMREARVVAGERFVIASIQAPHPHFRKSDDGYRVGYGWLAGDQSSDDISLHHRFILDLVASLDAGDLIDRNKVFLFGFSQACALNFRFAFTHPDISAGVVAVCGGIPGDLDDNSIYKTFSRPVFYLYRDDDEFYSQEQFGEFDKRLREYLPDYSSKHYRAKHEITDEMRSEIRGFLTGAMAVSSASVS